MEYQTVAMNRTARSVQTTNPAQMAARKSSTLRVVIGLPLPALMSGA
jgi:hypothetical protein